MNKNFNAPLWFILTILVVFNAYQLDVLGVKKWVLILFVILFVIALLYELIKGGKEDD